MIPSNFWIVGIVVCGRCYLPDVFELIAGVSSWLEFDFPEVLLLPLKFEWWRELLGALFRGDGPSSQISELRLVSSLGWALGTRVKFI